MQVFTNYRSLDGAFVVAGRHDEWGELMQRISKVSAAMNSHAWIHISGGKC